MKIELDDGFFFGKGVFETIKVVNKNPMFLDLHLNRINNSLKFLKIEKNISKEEVLNYINIIEENNFVLKLSVSDENTLFTTRKDNYITQDKNKRAKITLSNVRRNSTSHMVYHKSFNYYDNIIEKRKANEAGYDEIIFLNERDFITEGAVSNIFFVKENKLYTPSYKCGLLKGTIREYLLKNYDVTEDYIKLEDLKDFDSSFICNSLMGVVEVESICSTYFSQNKFVRNIKRSLEDFGF